ncbi:MAG: nucleoside phosphorylase [Bacteroidia bacterium]
MKASELPLTPDGKIYHLNMLPHQLASKVLLVGDPARVELAARFLDKKEVEGLNREFRWVTGVYKGEQVTLLSSGIGSDNIDIVLTELDALWNINLQTHQLRQPTIKGRLLRVGTSGALRQEIPVKSYIFSEWGMGCDTLPIFYRFNLSAEEESLREAFLDYWHKTYYITMPWYATRAGEFFITRAQEAGIQCGITYSASGFYGPQGRSTGRLSLYFEGLAEFLSRFHWRGTYLTNIEMEAAPLYALGKSLGHEVGTVCLVIANRVRGEFLYPYQKPMMDLLSLAMDWLVTP